MGKIRRVYCNWFSMRSWNYHISKLTKDVHVITNDTLVENPKIIEFVAGQMEKIQIYGQKLGLPIKTVRNKGKNN